MSGKATESDILAWIEGELPEDRASAVETAFAEDPTLRAWATSMQGDRSTLRAWADMASASAPGGLAESALEIVEREALLGPSVAETLAAETATDTSPLAFRIKRYAMAAAILLLVGVIAVTGVRFGPMAWRGGALEVVRVAPEQTIRLLEEEPSNDPHSDLLDVIASAGRDGPTDINGDDSAEGLALFDGKQIAALSMERESPAISEESVRSRRGVGMSRPMGAKTDYASLLADVLGKEAIAGGPVIAVLPEVAARSMRRLVLRVRADDPAGLSRAMQLRCGAPDSPAVGWSLIADSDDPGFAIIEGAVCTVRLPGELAGLEWLVDAIYEAGAGRVELTLRAEEGTRPGSRGVGTAGGSMDAAKALWWGEPISSWAMSVRISVLIEPSESTNTE